MLTPASARFCAAFVAASRPLESFCDLTPLVRRNTAAPKGSLTVSSADSTCRPLGGPTRKFWNGFHLLPHYMVSIVKVKILTNQLARLNRHRTQSKIGQFAVNPGLYVDLNVTTIKILISVYIIRCVPHATYSNLWWWLAIISTTNHY